MSAPDTVSELVTMTIVCFIIYLIIGVICIDIIPIIFQTLSFLIMR